jgi:hypothetical protein
MQGGTDSEEQFDRPKSKSEYSLPSADHRWHNVGHRVMKRIYFGFD